MHRVLSSSTCSKAAEFALQHPYSILKRHVNVNRTLKAPRTRVVSQAGNSTIALASLAKSRGADHLSWGQIQSIIIASSIPMVGFGFMDNFVMIQAGGYIDSTLGVKFGLATLTAAAMGQVLSDLSGVLFGGSLERFLSPHIKAPQLSLAQQKLPKVARLRLLGAAGGVVVGCLLGASTLYFVLDEDSSRPHDQLVQLQGLVQDMWKEEVRGASSCTMYVRHASHSISPREGVSIANLSQSNMAKECAQEGQLLNEDDKLYVPVFKDNEVVAVMELLQETAFSPDQEQAAKRMARHIGIFMNRMWNES